MAMRTLVCLLLIGAVLVVTPELVQARSQVTSPSGGGTALTVQEIDGAPAVSNVSGIKVTNGSLTDNLDGTVTVATSGAANVTVGTSAVTGGTASALLYVGAGPVLQQASITGLVLGNGASAPSAYAGVTCTNQVLRILSSVGAGTCITLTSAYVDTSIWTGTASSGLLKASSQGVLAQATAGTDYPGLAFANVFTTAQAVQPGTDAISLTLRRNGAAQTSKILEIQTELNATLASIDKTGAVTAPSFTASGSASGVIQANGITSGGFKIAPADATGQMITQTTAAQTVGAPTITIPDLAGASVTPAYTALAQTFTNKTIDCAATGNNCTIKREYYREVAGCNNATAGPVWNLPTSAAATAACDTGTNVFSAYLQFNDAANESYHGSFVLDTGFTGGIDWGFRYKVDAGTTGAMGWCVQLVRLPTGAAGDPAFPALSTSNCVSSTIPGTAGYEGLATISSVTCTSCVAGDRVFFRVSRDGAGTAVTDSATGKGRLVLSGPAYAVTY